MVGLFLGSLFLLVLGKEKFFRLVGIVKSLDLDS